MFCHRKTIEIDIYKYSPLANSNVIDVKACDVGDNGAIACYSLRMPITKPNVT
jgi:hypothetical protein